MGINVGYKLKIWKRITADFTIAGPGYSFNKLNLHFDSDISQESIDQIRQTIADRYNFLSDKLPEFETEEQNRTYRSNFSLPAFRYGISVGYSF